MLTTLTETQPLKTEWREDGSSATGIGTVGSEKIRFTMITPERSILVGNWTAEPQKGGGFLYKAKEQPTFSQQVKPVFKERPQYKLIEDYESVAKNRYKVDLHNTVIDIAQFLKTL